MNQCTQCKAPVEEDFGLVTCQSCGASFFIGSGDEERVEEGGSHKEESFGSENLESEPEEFSSQEVFIQEKLESFQEVETKENSSVENFEQKGFQEEGAENKESQNSEVFFENGVEDGDVDISSPQGESPEEAQESENQPFQNQNIESGREGDSDFEEGEAFSEPNEFIEQEGAITHSLEEDGESSQEPYQEEVSESELSEIQEYGNSELSQATQGPLLADVFIKNINTKEQKLILKDYLSDSRFGWDVSSILDSEKEGQIVIENISALKASILIFSLKNEDFQVSWNLKGVVNASV